MLRKFFVWRGARLLDKYAPNWFQSVNLETLNIYDGRVCLLAQIYGNYAIGLYRLDIFHGRWNGFDVNIGDRDGAQALTELWTAKILERRAM